MCCPKLTKNEIRFSALIRPAVGDVVEFFPVRVLISNVVVEDTIRFPYKCYVNGAKCKVIDNLEYTVKVYFMNDMTGIHYLVSPEFLIKRELTDKAVEALDALRNKLLL